MTDTEQILEKTHDGLDVFQHYLGEDINTIRSFRNPYRDDSIASCHLYYHQQKYGGAGRYYLHDFGDSTFHGDCFWFVGNIHNMDVRIHFQDILRMIDEDMSLGVFSAGKESAVHPQVKPVTHTVRPMVEKKKLRYWCQRRGMTPSDLDYWSRYGITAEVLNRYHVTSLKRYTSEKTVVQPREKDTFSIFPDERSPLFGYLLPDGGIKIYHPNSSVRFLYGGKLPDPYIFGKEQLSLLVQPQDILYVTGGEKDVLSLASHGFAAVCYNSETYRLQPRDVESLQSHCRYIALLYDSDETGVRESYTRTEELSGYPVFRVQLPLSGTKKEKDISDFFALGHTSEELRSITLEALTWSQKKMSVVPSMETISPNHHPFINQK